MRCGSVTSRGRRKIWGFWSTNTRMIRAWKRQNRNPAVPGGKKIHRRGAFCLEKHGISRFGYFPKFHQMLHLISSEIDCSGSQLLLFSATLLAAILVSATLLSPTLLSATLTLSYSILSYSYSQQYCSTLSCSGLSYSTVCYSTLSYSTGSYSTVSYSSVS